MSRALWSRKFREANAASFQAHASLLFCISNLSRKGSDASQETVYQNSGSTIIGRREVK
jgi:hypothetical protein